jgi:hypothetical protein
MESDKVYNKEVYIKFCKAWTESTDTWCDFVQKLDIGLNLIDYTEWGEHNYKIVDKEKWCFAKLKYGL